MQKYDIIEKAILKKDVYSLRQSVANIIMVDRNFSSNEFYEVLKYVNNKINIMEPNLIGELISTGKSSYSDKDLAKAIFELKENFCKERIEDVKKIGRELYPIQKQVPKGETQPKKAIHHQNKKSKLPIILLGILVVGIVVILVGLLIK